MRLLGLHKELINIWEKNWQKMIKNKDGGYNNWIDKWKRYDLKQLWNFGTYVCKFKERK